MKLSEIKMALESGEQIEFLDIEVKSYLPIASKMVMVLGYDNENGIHDNGIVDESIEFNNGIAYVNLFNKEISIVCNIMNWYADIEIDNIELENTLYDYYLTSGLWKYVRNYLGNEYDILMNFINNSIEEEMRKHNSIESILNNNITNLIKKVPTDVELKSVITSTFRQLNSMDWNKVPMIKQMFDTLNNKVD